MSTPFQTYLLEAIKKYDTPLGFYYDPIRDQSVKGDDPYFFPNEKPNLIPPQNPDLGPRPEFFWQTGMAQNHYNLALILSTMFDGQYNDAILDIMQSILGRLPNNVEDWQEYFDSRIQTLLNRRNFVDRILWGPKEMVARIPEIIDLLTDAMNEGLGGLLDTPLFTPPSPLADIPLDFLEWHFNQHLQELIDFLSDYEYGG